MLIKLFKNLTNLMQNNVYFVLQFLLKNMHVYSIVIYVYICNSYGYIYLNAKKYIYIIFLIMPSERKIKGEKEINLAFLPI